MRLIQTNSEIELLLTRLRDGRIDLQPDFQRGNVWPAQKKQRLIDTVLRSWHIPPLHFIREDSGRQLVLDGQQRLTAIHEFSEDLFPVNGKIDPIMPDLQSLHGLRLRDLPLEVRQRFLAFPIQVVDLIDYSPEEPFELFFRLNEPVSLTSAEKRNAFFGPARDEVRDLVEHALAAGWSKETVGFTNSRMAYDDILARVALTLENGTLREQLPGAAVTRKYRSGTHFEPSALAEVHDSLEELANIPAFRKGQLRFNRATLFSWLIFIARLHTVDSGADARHRLRRYAPEFEAARANLRASRRHAEAHSESRLHGTKYNELLEVYEDRTTSRVLDTASVLLRDLVLWLMFVSQYGGASVLREAPLLIRLNEALGRGNAEAQLYRFIEESSWGTLR